MTFIGKLFVMINLTISLLMAVTAFGLYVAGIDWSDKAGKDGQPAGKMLGVRKDIEDVLARLPVAEGSWKSNRAELFSREDVRRTERLWSDTEMAKLVGGKGPVSMVDATASATNPSARPILIPAEFGGQPLMTRDIYDTRLGDHQRENAMLRDDLAKKVKEDDDQTRRLAGDKDTDPEPRVRGIRRELVEERFKRLGIVDEQGVTSGLQINVAVESQLILDRLDDLDGRIQELGRYLKKKHNVDVPSKWR